MLGFHFLPFQILNWLNYIYILGQGYPYPPPPGGYPSAPPPPPPSYEGYPPPASYDGYPPPPPPPGHPYPPPGGYQGYFNQGYPPPPQPYEVHHYDHCHQNDDSCCCSFIRGWYESSNHKLLLSFSDWFFSFFYLFIFCLFHIILARIIKTCFRFLHTTVPFMVVLPCHMSTLPYGFCLSFSIIKLFSTLVPFTLSFNNIFIILH